MLSWGNYSVIPLFLLEENTHLQCDILVHFVISFFTSGPDTVTFPVKVYSMLRFSVTPEVNAASTMLILLTVLLMVIMMVLQSQAQKKPKG